MLATLTEKEFDSSQWIYEIKWDGYRVISEIKNKIVNLYSRNGISFNKQFEPVARSLEKLPVDTAVFDGEIVVLGEKGKSDFKLLQQYIRTKKGFIVYYIFDILFINGFNLLDVELISRKKILKEIIAQFTAFPDKESGHIRLSDYIENDGINFFKIATKNDLEGIIAKKKDSTYEPGRRSRTWLKMKSKKRQEIIICGYTNPRGSRQKIGSLITGVYDNGELVFTGQVGGGLDEKEIDELYEKLLKLKTESQPFKIMPKTNSKPHWVIPELVAEIEFSEWTQKNLMRHPVYIGLRIDKKAKEVILERPENINVPPYGSTKVILTNPDKVFWPEEKITKKELFEY